MVPNNIQGAGSAESAFNFQPQLPYATPPAGALPVAHNNPFLARLQARSAIIAGEDTARKQEQDAKIQKSVEEILPQVRIAVASQKAREIVMNTGQLNLHIWNSPAEKGCKRGFDDKTLYIEPPEWVSGFDQVIEAVKAEVLPYASENSTRKGFRDGHVFYVINCQQNAQLDRQGNLTLFQPKTRHTTHQTPSGQSLAMLEEAYLGLRKTTDLFEKFKAAFENNLSYRESLQDQIARGMGNKRAIVLRLNINKPYEKRKINDQFSVVEYHAGEGISVLELAELVNSIKKYTMLPVRCSFQQTAWEGFYLTDSANQDSHSQAFPTTVDLIFPSEKQNVTEEEVYGLRNEYKTY
jgi:hypothetical protein